MMRISTDEGTELAMKIQTASHVMGKEQDLLTEYNVMKKLSHDNIIAVGKYFTSLNLEKFKNHSETRGFTMELAQCDLLTFLKNNHPSPLHPCKIRYIFLGIAQAVRYLHG